MTPTETLLRELIRGVAQATVELVTEEYDDMAWARAERRQIAEAIEKLTVECAVEFPESELARLRNVIATEEAP